MKPFEGFTRYRGPSRDCHTSFDFLGTFVHHDFLRGLDIRNDPPFVEPPYPPVDEDFPAWIDLLTAVEESRGSFTMMEVGAGFGVWSIRGALAARQRGLRCCITAIEAHPEHFAWLERHAATHDVEARLIHAAVSDYEGEADFCLALPEYPFWYGQSFSVPPGAESVKVPVIRLEGMLEQPIDFIHMDVQGEESRILRSSIEALNRGVRRIHIGTHSTEIENELRELFTAHGWRSVFDYPAHQAIETQWGAVQFVDGVQSWISSR